jgi:lysozyme family protein
MNAPVSDRVLKLIDDVIKREGGYSNHPSDRGGPTRYGVTQAVARANGYGGDMRSFPRDWAVRIYLDSYYAGPGFERVMKLFPRLAEELVDTGINMGTGRAAGFLQRALNALNRRGRDYPDIAVDNQIGPRTAGSLQAFKDRRGAKDAEAVLLRLVEGFQATRYVEIAEANPKQEDFLFGWIFHRIGNTKE